MPNKIWEMVNVVERYNISAEPLLWGECLRLLEGNPDEFLNERISNFSDVNDGFLEARAWLRQQGLNATNGTLMYALQCTACAILFHAKDKDNRPEKLTDDWLRFKKNHMKYAYAKLPFFQIDPVDRILTRAQRNWLMGFLRQFLVLLVMESMTLEKLFRNDPDELDAANPFSLYQGINFIATVSLVLYLALLSDFWFHYLKGDLNRETLDLDYLPEPAPDAPNTDNRLSFF